MVSTFRTSFPQIPDHHPRLIHPDWPAHSFHHVTKPSKITPCHPHIAYWPLPTNCQHNFFLHLYNSWPTTRRQYDRHDILSWSWLQFENLLWPAVLPSGLLCTPQQTSPLLSINKSFHSRPQNLFSNASNTMSDRRGALILLGKVHRKYGNSRRGFEILQNGLPSNFHSASPTSFIYQPLSHYSRHPKTRPLHEGRVRRNPDNLSRKNVHWPTREGNCPLQHRF